MIRMRSGYLVHVAHGDPKVAAVAVSCVRFQILLEVKIWVWKKLLIGRGGSIPSMNKFERPNETKPHIFFLSRFGIRSAKVLDFAASVNFSFQGIILITFSFGIWKYKQMFGTWKQLEGRE